MGHESFRKQSTLPQSYYGDCIFLHSRYINVQMNSFYTVYYSKVVSSSGMLRERVQADVVLAQQPLGVHGQLGEGRPSSCRAGGAIANELHHLRQEQRRQRFTST